MNEDFWLIVPIPVMWAVLAIVYAFAPWGGMVGYAYVWGFGALLFLLLSVVLAATLRQPREAVKRDSGGER